MSSVAEIDDVVAALDVLAKVQWAEVPTDVAGDALVELMAVGSRLESAKAELAAVFDADKGWTVDGSKSLGAWLAYRSHQSKSRCDRVRRRGRDLAHMPVVAAALAAGEISTGHVERLAVARHGRETLFAQAEAFLVDKATVLRWRSWQVVVRRWELAVADNDGDDELRDQTARRTLHASRTLDGMGRLDGWLDPIAFAAFSEALDRIEQELFEQDWAQARAERGDAACEAHLARTPAQRRADALVEMAHRSQTAPADGKRPLPLVNIVCDWDTFQAVLTGGPIDPEQLRCELLDGTPIPPAAVLEAALLGHVRRVVFDSSDVVVDMGRKQRLFTGPARDAVLLMHPTCTHHSCDVPASKCEIDHVVDWQYGGRTDSSNGEPKCRYHNVRKRAGP